MTSTAPASSETAAGSRPPRRRRRGRVLWFVLLILVLLPVLALGGAWWWSGQDGSLARTLYWASGFQPLQAEGVQGSLRRGGQVERLQWQQDGLRVEVQGAELRWTPDALLQRRVQVDRLAAAHILIEDQGSAEPAEPSSGPPRLPPLPVQIEVQDIEIGELRWAGPPEFVARELQASLQSTGSGLQLDLARAQAQDGHWQGRVLLDLDGPLALDAVLAGVVDTSVPAVDSAPPLSLLARVHGPLADMQAQARLQALDSSVRPVSAQAVPALPPARQDLPALEAPDPAAAGAMTRLEASARITPWDEQPLPQAQARFQALDVGALWSEAPRTLLGGRVDLQPVQTEAGSGWDVQADIDNTAPGPWDRQQLPLEDLQLAVQWVEGVAEVRQLQARLGGGSLNTSGRWVAPPDAPVADEGPDGAQADGPALGQWQLDTRLQSINPAALDSRLAAYPLDGEIAVSGHDLRVDFDARLQPAANASAVDVGAASEPAQELTRQLQALRLKHLKLQGSWNEPELDIRQLDLHTDTASLGGTVRGDVQAEGGQARLQFQAPGVQLDLDGALWAEHGEGQLSLQLQDARRTLAWARGLPGLEAWLQEAGASGQAQLQARWRGGWRQPGLQARLQAPALELQLPAAQGDSESLQLQALDLSLDGQLAGERPSFQLALSGRLHQDERRLLLQLQGEGQGQAPGGDLAAASWDLRLHPQQLEWQDPALGAETWWAHVPEALQARWSPRDGGQFELQPGSLRVGPDSGVQSLRIDWEPLSWHQGELDTRGQVRGLNMSWAELLAGPALEEAGLSGDLELEADWNLKLGRELHLDARLKRSRGDLQFVNRDEDSGQEARVALGLSELMVQLRNEGPELHAELGWDSTQAGRARAVLSTRLTDRGPQADVRWDWPQDAPLQGQLQLSLPQLSTWSMLAPPGWRLRGQLEGELNLGGTRSDPQLQGTIGGQRLALRSVVDGVQLGRGRLQARLDGTRLLIDEFTLQGPGREGRGGQISAKGEAGLIDGRMQARMTASIDKLRASVRSDRQMTVSGRVEAGLEGQDIRVDGDLRVDQAWIELADENAPSLDDDVVLLGASQTPEPETPSAEPAGASPLNVQARMDIDLGEDFQLRGMGLETRLAGVLQLRASGPLDSIPQLRGEVRTLDGRFRAYGQHLEIDRGVIAFEEAVDNPRLDILALRPNYVSDQRVGVLVQGTALLPQVRLYSQPQLSDNQTLSWLLLGRAAPDSGAEAAMLQTAALAMLGGRDGGSMADKLGLDELGFSSDGSGDVAGTSVTLGKRLSDKLYAAYEHSLAGAGGTLLIFYELSRRWLVRGQTGEDSAVDLIFRLSFD